MRLSHGLGLRVSFCLQEVDDTLFEVALHDDFSIFGTSAYSTFTFQQFAQFFQIIVGAHETGDKSDDFATPVLAVQLYTQDSWSTSRLIDLSNHYSSYFFLLNFPKVRYYVELCN